MKKWEWRDEYCIGNEAIDKQHQLFFAWLEEFDEAVTKGEGGEHLFVTIERLVAYARNHFAFEEQLMQKGKYEHFTRHRALHEAFKNDLAVMIKKHAKGALRALELSEFVGGWLRQHIMTEDQKFKDIIALDIILE